MGIDDEDFRRRFSIEEYRKVDFLVEALTGNDLLTKMDAIARAYQLGLLNGPEYEWALKLAKELLGAWYDTFPHPKISDRSPEEIVNEFEEALNRFEWPDLNPDGA